MYPLLAIVDVILFFSHKASAASGSQVSATINPKSCIANQSPTSRPSHGGIFTMVANSKEDWILRNLFYLLYMRAKQLLINFIIKNLYTCLFNLRLTGTCGMYTIRERLVIHLFYSCASALPHSVFILSIM